MSSVDPEGTRIVFWPPTLKVTPDPVKTAVTFCEGMEKSKIAPRVVASERVVRTAHRTMNKFRRGEFLEASAWSRAGDEAVRAPGPLEVSSCSAKILPDGVRKPGGIIDGR
jgi:hypothetical protein